MKIIVPYRDRREHLSQFIPHMRKHYPQHDLVIVQQDDDKPFNRGKLLNIGFLECSDTHYIFHDVDMLPIDADYSARDGVTQLALSKIQIRDYLGGVTMFDTNSFIISNGYPNDFGRAEDNCMMFTLKRLGMPVAYAPQRFETLPHARPGMEFDYTAWKRAQQDRGLSNGLLDCQYGVSKIPLDNYLLLKCVT